MEWLSRKFVLSVVQLGLLVFLPIFYKKLEIGDEIIMTVLIASSGLVGTYTGFNVLQKKFQSSGDDGSV